MAILKLDFEYSCAVHMMLCVLCILTYFVLSPIENIYKPIADEEKKKYRLIAVTLAFITVILSSVIYMYFIKSTIVMDMAMLSVAVSMIIEKLRKGGCCDEKH